MEDDQEPEHPVRNLVLSVCDLKQHGEIPGARCGAQTYTMATRMYLHGGCDEKQVYGDLYLLEIEQMKWTEQETKGQVPPPRWGHTLEGYETELVLFGGMTEEQGLLSNEAGRPSGPPPFAAGLAWGHSGTPNNSVYTLQTESMTWQVPGCVGTAPTPRVFHSACIANDLYVVFGGSSSADLTQPMNDLHWLDLRSMQWNSPSCAGTPPSRRFSQKMICTPDNQLFVFGGAETPTGPQVSPGTLYSFNLSTSTWSTVQVLGTPPLERAFHTFDLIGKWGFILAGSTDTSSINDLYILDVPNMRWARPMYEGQVNVRTHASSVLHDKLIVFGGVRDKTVTRKGATETEPHISKKLFFLNVLQVKSGFNEGDFKFKLVTIGDSGVGKSCLLTRFVQDYYSDFQPSTLGVDFKTVITMVKGRVVKLQLWDTAGQERFSVVTGNYYRNSDGFIFVYDATNRASFDHVEQWLGQVQQHTECGPSTIKILVANKMDVTNELVVSEEEGRAKAESMGAFFVGTSAKTASNVDMAFLTAAQNLVETRRRMKQQMASKNVPLSSNPAPRLGPGGSSNERGKCCAGGGGKNEARGR